MHPRGPRFSFKKALLFMAALGAAGIATSVAQSFSVNAVGFVNQTIPNNFSMIANPFKNATNTLCFISWTPSSGVSR